VELRAAGSAPPGEAHPAPGTAPSRHPGKLAAIAAGSALLLLAAGLFLVRSFTPEASSPTRRFDVLTLDRHPMATGGGRMVAISPDGRRLAYVDRGGLVTVGFSTRPDGVSARVSV